MLKPCRVVTRLILGVYWPEKNENISLQTLYLTKPNTLTNGLLYISEKNAEKKRPLTCHLRASCENYPSASNPLRDSEICKRARGNVDREMYVNEKRILLYAVQIYLYGGALRILKKKTKRGSQLFFSFCLHKAYRQSAICWKCVKNDDTICLTLKMSAWHVYQQLWRVWKYITGIK